jgi:hypothetical protein
MDETTTAGWCCVTDSYQDSYKPRDNYGLSVIDIPQLFNGSFVYRLPVGTGKPLLNQAGPLNTILGGWQVASTFQVHSGIPFTPIMADSTLSYARAGAWYPNRLGTGTLASPTTALWFDTGAFIQPMPGTFGNSGRDILRGPNWQNINLSLAKNLAVSKFGESGQLQIRVDAYDLLNHPNFGMPDPTIGSSTSGEISSANTSRNLQLGAKLSF